MFINRNQKGFEIYINEESPIIVASEELVYVMMCLGYSDFIRIAGIDAHYNSITWRYDGLNLNDKIVIKVVDVDKTSPVKNISPRSREELKKEYYELKTELSKKGLI